MESVLFAPESQAPSSAEIVESKGYRIRIFLLLVTRGLQRMREIMAEGSVSGILL